MPVLPSAGSFGRAPQERFCTLCTPPVASSQSSAGKAQRTIPLLQETEQITAQQDREEVDREMMGQLLCMLLLCITEMSMAES